MADILSGLGQAAGDRRSPAPVHLWNPPFCGDIDMVIRRDGTWHYEGTPIGRPALVRLFASILRRDGDDYFLVTPAEKVGIKVEDVPFIGVRLDWEGVGRERMLTVETNVGERVTIDEQHALRVEFAPDTDEPSPYVHVRSTLEARLSRPAFYELVEIACIEPIDGRPHLGVWSAGRFFPIAPEDALS